MQKDPTYVTKEHRNVIFKSNAPGELNDVFVKKFKELNFIPISYYDLFPDLREYTPEEIDQVLKQKKSDLFIVINLQKESVNSGITFSTYNIGDYNYGYVKTGSGVQINFSIFFYEDVSNISPFVRVDGHVLSNGGIGDRGIPLAKKLMDQTLVGLIEKKVLIKPMKIKK